MRATDRRATLCQQWKDVTENVRIAEVVEESIQQAWTRGPFDRLIVAQAKTGDAPLLSKDRTILEHYPGAVW